MNLLLGSFRMKPKVCKNPAVMNSTGAVKYTQKISRKLKLPLRLVIYEGSAKNAYHVNKKELASII